MKKLFLLAFVVLFSTSAAIAQNSYATVTATVSDPSGNPLAGGVLTATLVNSAGQQIQMPVKLSDGTLYNGSPTRAFLDPVGHFSVSIPTNPSVSSPANSQWSFVITAPTGPSIVVYPAAWNITYATSISGGTDLSAAMSAQLTGPVSFVNPQTGQAGFLSLTTAAESILPSTVANLPAATTANRYFRRTVSDGISATDCTVGGGTTAVSCWNPTGSGWSVSGGSGTGNAITALTGDVTATGPGSAAAAVVKVNGASVPTSQSCIGTNGGGQFIGGTCTGGNAFVSCSNSGADQTAINAAVTAACSGSGPKRIVLASTCSLSAHITACSGMTLDWTGATLNYVQGAPDNVITNTAQGAAAQRSFADAVTVAGSSTITSAALASFTSADIGQTLRCAGAYGSGGLSPGETLGTDFWTRISSVASGTSITTDDPMAVSLNPTTCYIYTRDHDINLIGDGGRIFQSGVGTATANPIILMQSVNRLYMRGVATADGTSLTTVSTTGGKAVMLRDVRDVEVDGLNVNGWQILQDGIDIYGPARNVTVAHMRGQSGDDFTSVSSIGGGVSNVFQNPLGIQGPVDNVHIIDAMGCSYANEHGTQSFGPQGTPLPMTNLYFDISGAACGNGNGFSIGGLFDQGYFEGLTAKIGGYYTGYGVSLQGITGGNMRFDIAAPIASNASPYHAGGILLQVVQPGYSPATATNIENLEASYYAADHNTQYLYFQDASATVHQQKHHVQVGNFSGGVFSPFWILGGFDDFLADGQINYNSASTSTCIICLTGTNVAPTGAAVGGVVHDRLNITHQSGSAAAGSHIYLTPLSTFNPSLVHADVSGASDMPLDTTARLDNLIFINGAGATLGSYTIENSRVDHINTCFFNSGGTLSGTGTIFNNVTTNMTVPASCAPYVPNSPTVVAAPAAITNQTSSLSTATVAYTSTSANQRVQWTCDLSTGSTTGTGTVSTQSTINNYTDYNLSPTMTFSAHNYLHWSAVFDMGASGTVLKYGTTYVAGSGGSYNLSCTAVRLQ